MKRIQVRLEIVRGIDCDLEERARGEQYICYPSIKAGRAAAREKRARGLKVKLTKQIPHPHILGWHLESEVPF